MGPGVNAPEHFRWARDRAMEYVEMGDGALAMSSLVSDLNKHEGTAHIMADLSTLMIGEYLIDGVRGVKRFIEGLPEPAASEESAR